MKLIFFVLLLMSITAFAQTPVEAVVNKDLEIGQYYATDTETGEVQASILLREDHTVNFSVKTTDFVMPDPGCEGVYSVTGNILSADLKCPLEDLEQIHVDIDVTTVTPEAIRSEAGALVPIKIDLLGEDPVEFRLKYAEPVVVPVPVPAT